MDALYDTTDWRSFLRVRLGQLGLMQKDLTAALGLSRAWLSNVVAGQRRLDAELVPKIARALHLDPEATEYFEALADLENDSGRARRAAWAVIAAKQRQRASAGMRQEELLALSRWYVAAVMELARCQGFRPEAAWIARTMRPAITAEQAAEALTTLIRLRMLEPDERGGLVVTRPERWSETDLPEGEMSGAAADSHRATLAHAATALSTMRSNERRIVGFSAAVSEAHQARIMARIKDLERELVALAEDDPGERTRVYHLGLQWFPVSEFTDTEDHSIATSSQGPPPDIDPDTTE